jgi:hypothetical protein
MCGKQANLDSKDKLIVIGRCGGCSQPICGDCIDTHLEICIPFQMQIKENSILH